MAPRVKRQRVKKPILIKCGDNYINPNDVSLIRRIVKGNKSLYLVKFLSNPNPEFPTWVRDNEIESLLNHFNIIVTEE